MDTKKEIQEEERRKRKWKHKSLLVWQILLENTDENHAMSSSAIKDALEERGVEAEEHSIRRDIKDLIELLENIQKKNLLAESQDRINYELKYDASLKGYHIYQRPYEFEDLKLLAATVHSSKFLSKSAERSLIDAIKGLCTIDQGDEIEYETCLVDREKTKNTSMTANISAINVAIKADTKLKFQYLQYTLADRENQVPRRNGNDYIVSPYYLLINEGNYYLLAFDGSKARTFRVDRMKKAQTLSDKREGKKLMSEIDIRNYTKKTFSMFSGEETQVRIRFTKDMLDTVIDRFGANGGTYSPDDNRHFIFSGNVNVSPKFYGWLCSFGKKATVISPPAVVNDMKEYVKGILERYE